MYDDYYSVSNLSYDSYGSYTGYSGVGATYDAGYSPGPYDFGSPGVGYSLPDLSIPQPPPVNDYTLGIVNESAVGFEDIFAPGAGSLYSYGTKVLGNIGKGIAQDALSNLDYNVPTDTIYSDPYTGFTPSQ